MKKLLLSLLALSFLFTSCLQEELLVESDTANVTTTTSTSTEAVTRRIIRNRTKLKQKKNTNYKSIIPVEDPENTVNSLAVELFPNGDIQPSPANFIAELVGENGNGVNKFRFNQANFENGDPTGLPFLQKTTMLDANGDPLEAATEHWVTVQDNDGSDATIQEFVHYTDVETVQLKVKYTGENAAQIASVGAIFKNLETGAETVDPVPATIEASSDPETGADDVTLLATLTISYEISDLQREVFINPGTIATTLVVLTADGQELDNDTFNLDPEEQEVYEFKNFSHKNKPNRVIRIKGNVQPRPTGGAPTNAPSPSSLTITIPDNITNQGTIELVMEPTEGSDGKVFVGRLDVLEDIPVGTTYTAMVKAFDEEGRELASKDIPFTIEEDEIPEGVVVKNSSHKIKLNGNHNIRVKLEGQEVDAANAITVEIPEANDDGSSQIVILARANGSNENPVFQGAVGASINVIAGLVYVSPTTIYDAEGNVLAQELIEFTVEEVAQPEGIALQNLKLKRNGDEPTFTLTVKVIGEDRNEVALIDINIEPLDGGAEGDPAEFNCFLTNTTDYNRTFKNTIVAFEDEDNVVGMEYAVEVIFINAEGEVIGEYVEIVTYGIE